MVGAAYALSERTQSDSLDVSGEVRSPQVVEKAQIKSVSHESQNKNAQTSPSMVGAYFNQFHRPYVVKKQESSVKPVNKPKEQQPIVKQPTVNQPIVKQQVNSRSKSSSSLSLRGSMVVD